MSSSSIANLADILLYSTILWLDYFVHVRLLRPVLLTRDNVQFCAPHSNFNNEMQYSLNYFVWG